MSLVPGARLGPYEIVAQIGAGGMGEVYRATDTKLNRDIALKVLPEAFTADADRLARFKREAQVLAALNHPGIAAIYGFEEERLRPSRAEDLGIRGEGSASVRADSPEPSRGAKAPSNRDGGGVPGARGEGGTPAPLSDAPIHALVMELVEGPTLADRIAQGPMPVDEALPIARQIAEALEAAHEQGIIHRDLKPANIKVRDDGTTKVLDFGLAKALEPPGGSGESGGPGGLSMSPTITTPAMTQAGMILGTAAYMSPEQAKGRPADKRSDIWAFGAVLYEMLSGRRAFEAEDVSETMAAVLMKEPDWTALPPVVPAPVKTAIQRCLVKDRKLRIHDIADVALALEGAFATAAPPAAGQRRLQFWQRPIPAGLGALALAVAGGLVVWLMRPAGAGPEGVIRLSVPSTADALALNLSDRQLAITPDGRQIVYSASTSTGAVLAVRSLDRFDATLLSSSDAGAPFASPDGQWLGFTDSTSGQVLQKVPIAGGLAITLAHMPTRIYGASWGDDGQIVFGTSGGGLFRVSADGGDPVPLTTLDAARGDTSHRWASIIPNRRAVLFTRVGRQRGLSTLQNSELAVLDMDSGVVTPLQLAGTGPQYVSTGHLVYAGSDGSLRAVPFDVGSLSVAGTAAPVVEGVAVSTAGAANFAVSNNGRLVYIRGTAGALPRRPAFVGPDGHAETLEVPPDSYLSPRLSPDQGRLAIQTSDSEGDQIWTYDLSGARQIQQLTLEGDNTRPIWTPDGERLTFASNRDGTTSIYWQPADGSATAERLTTAPDGDSHLPGTWSPDGRVLAYMVQHGSGTGADVRWEIWTLTRTSDGWASEPLLRADGRVYLGPEFSPDGKWLAYGAGETVTTQDVYVEPFPRTGQIVRISRDGGYWPFWSRDGKRIFYRSVSTSAGNRLRSVDAEQQPAFRFGNELVLPVTNFTVVTYYRDYDITSDGKLLMIFPERANAEQEGMIDVVLNWTDELKTLVPTK